jgi:hypothetical protein
MSFGSQLIKAESLLVDIESYVRFGVWHSGKNCQVIAEIAEVDSILKQVEESHPSVFVQIYLHQANLASTLRKRWLATKDSLPKNPAA